jgi:hypothetical protein
LVLQLGEARLTERAGAVSRRGGGQVGVTEATGGGVEELDSRPTEVIQPAEPSQPVRRIPAGPWRVAWRGGGGRFRCDGRWGR